MSNSENTGQKQAALKPVILPKMLTNTLDQMHDPFVIKDLESRYIYANNSVAKFLGLRSPDRLISKRESEIQSPLTEIPDIVEEWQLQDRYVTQHRKSVTLLEIHHKHIEHPYIIRKMPFYNDDEQCVGVLMYSHSIENFNLRKYIKINAPGSLLLNKPDDFFTEKECEIVFLKLQGMKVKEIGHILELTPALVEKQLAELYEKSGANHSDDFSAFCEQRNYHRYLPESFIQQQRNVCKKDNYFNI